MLLHLQLPEIFPLDKVGLKSYWPSPTYVMISLPSSVCLLLDFNIAITENMKTNKAIYL